jgi:spore maturation protein CgeB
MQYDYGDPERGFSYEYNNFYLSLKDMGHDVMIFDYMEELRRRGRIEMNRLLQSSVIKYQPQLAVFSLYTDQLDPEVVNSLREHTKTLCFFHDDTWRVEYSMFWARHFDFFTTPDIYGERKYARHGLRSAIYFPFGCNERLYVKQETTKKHDVSFIGAWHPYREWLVNRIRKAGIAVEVVGYRWPRGMTSLEGMVRLFNESKINLNMSNSATWDARYLLSSPRALVNRIRSPKTIEQLKARHFEINGCGAFQLSYYVEGLEQQYHIGKEIGIYSDADDLVGKVKMYLEDNDLRTSIAEAGCRRTLSDHTFSKRFDQVFRRMGFV